MAAPWRKQPGPGSGSTPPQPLHITRLDPSPQPRAGQAPPPQAPLPVNLFGARFPGHGAALTLVAAAGDAARHVYPPVRRAPDGAAWVLVSPDNPAQAELTWALGGTPYHLDGSDLVSPRGRRYPWAEVHSWPDLSLVELAAAVAPGQAAADQEELIIVTTGGIARWVIDTFTSDAFDLKVSTARLQGLFRASQQPWPAVLVHVTGRGNPVPRARTRALSGLPHTIVCRMSGGRLLVDQRLALPLPDEELGRLVPGDQTWLLAGELGIWQFTERSAEFPPPLRAAKELAPPPLPPQGRLPAGLGITVALVRDEQPRTADALLVRDSELVPLRRFLAGHRAGEQAFLVLGPGWHLLAEPGQGVSDIPFGVPLHRIGPGALYQEVGYRLRPAIPAAARAALFNVGAQSIVILTAGEVHRLSLSATVPVWSLWLGKTVVADQSAHPLSDPAAAILRQVDEAGAKAARPELTAGAPDPRLEGLRSEGFLLEQQGRLAEAARKYWEAGEHALAGRLYELAAEADR